MNKTIWESCKEPKVIFNRPDISDLNLESDWLIEKIKKRRDLKKKNVSGENIVVGF